MYFLMCLELIRYRSYDSIVVDIVVENGVNKFKLSTQDSLCGMRIGISTCFYRRFNQLFNKLLAEKDINLLTLHRKWKMLITL